MTAEPRALRTPPRPPDDDLRLAVLRTYGILDTDPEQEYDDLVRLAAAICGTSMAAMTLVDEDRQWLKAKLGLSVDETPRDHAFCAYTILEPDRLLEVPDATADERFRDNPLVTADDGIRFYAGVPLTTADDTALGALCVIDTRPRRLTDDQREALEALARQVVAQLELRRTLADVALRERRIAESEARYRHLAQHDGLTGLANRSRFHAELDRLRGRAIGLCFVDLDLFKEVNDAHGHEAGDAVLQHVAEALRHAAGDGALVARLGGDEFVVVLQGADERAMRRLVTRVARAVERPVELSGGAVVRVGCSAGWVLSEGGFDPDELLRRADRAMYDVKQAGRRGSVRISEGDPLAEDLRRALDAGEVDVHLQPLHDVGASGGAPGRVVGAEALARWTSPVHGTVPPDVFVAVAERTGLVTRLGRHVLRRAAQLVAGWDRQGLLPPHFRLHVNLAAGQLHPDVLLADLDDVLRATGLRGDRLCLEVTEAGLAGRDVTPEIGRRLAERGVVLVLDDFGTGPTSLRVLRDHPLVLVKLDRSLVARLGLGGPEDAVVAAVVGLAGRLGIPAVAEGVETAEQLERVRAAGCRVVQGHLGGQPVPPERFAGAHLARPRRTSGAVPLPAPRSAPSGTVAAS
jgi:diguanylate cyclase